MSTAEVPSQRRRELADLAEAVAETCSPSGRVEPSLALIEEDVRIRYGDFADQYDGLIECRTSGFWIYVDLPRNGGRPDAPRARFTLAHEAGHYFIDEHRRALLAGLPPHGSITDFAAHSRVELEADLFAAHLLMPAASFSKRFRRAGKGLAAVLHLADTFGTSITSTAIRVAQLDLESCAVIRWRSDRTAWSWIAPSLYRQGLRRTIASPDEAPHGGATFIVLNSRAAHARTTPISTGATASFWFEGVRTGGSRDLLVLEEAIGLGSHGALTFLSHRDY